MLKLGSYSYYIKKMNESLEIGTFPESLKLADITPVFKRKDPLNKTNCCAVSVLPSMSKLFEKIVKKQINGNKFIALFMWLQKRL